MARNIEIQLDIIPPKATAQGKGVMVIGGKPRFFKKKAQSESEQTYLSMLYPYRPEVPMEGALYLLIQWTFPWRKTEKKKNIEYGYMPHTCRPDLDNLEKQLIDSMGRIGFFNDDAQIAEKKTTKGWGSRPGIRIVIEELPAI